MMIEITNKIIICNQQIDNILGVALQCENITNYIINSKVMIPYYSLIIEFFEKGCKAYQDMYNINKTYPYFTLYIQYLSIIHFHIWTISSFQLTHVIIRRHT